MPVTWVPQIVRPFGAASGVHAFLLLWQLVFLLLFSLLLLVAIRVGTVPICTFTRCGAGTGGVGRGVACGRAPPHGAGGGAAQAFFLIGRVAIRGG